MFLWAFTNSFGLPWPDYFIFHPWGLWACHQPLSFFICITLGLLWSILPFLGHILPMDLLLFLGSLKPVCFLKAHLFILWPYNPLFLPLRLNGFSIQLLTHFCWCCWASSFYWASQNKHQHIAILKSFLSFHPPLKTLSTR